MQAEFFLMQIACFDNQSAKPIGRSAPIPQEICGELGCYSKQAPQQRMPIFFSILILLRNAVFQHRHLYLDELAAKGRSASRQIFH